MKSLVALASIIIAMTALPASAQQGGRPRQPGGPGGQRGPRDCSQAADPTACAAHREARQKAAEACKGKAAPSASSACASKRRTSIAARRAIPSNVRHANGLRPPAGPAGPAFKQCVQQKMPPADCSKAADPARCEQHQKAREACKDKIGTEHRSCLRDILAPPSRASGAPFHPASGGFS